MLVANKKKFPVLITQNLFLKVKAMDRLKLMKKRESKDIKFSATNVFSIFS